MDFVTKHSADNRKDVSITGAVRDTQDGKVRYDLVGRHMLKRLAALLARGAAHHGERNWEKGQAVARTAASMERHMYNYLDGERDEDHLAAVIFNAMSIIHVEEEVLHDRLPTELLDFDFYKDDPKYSDFFVMPDRMEAIVLEYMEAKQGDSLYGEWQDWEYMKKATFPTLHDGAFGDILVGLMNKGWIVARVVDGQVRPDYILDEALMKVNSGELLDYDDYQYEDED